MATKVEDHGAEAIERLPELLKSKPKIRAYLMALCTAADDLEDAFWALLTERSVDTAIGAQLDVIGRMVGQDRNGLVDADYRRFIRARVAANRSRGIVSDYHKVTRAVLADPDAVLELKRHAVASVVYKVTGIALDAETIEILMTFLRETKAGGVRLIVEYTSAVPAEAFRWDQTAWDSGFRWSQSVE